MKIKFPLFICLALGLALSSCSTAMTVHPGIAQPTSTQPPPPSPTPNIDSTPAAQMKNNAQITLSDRGKTFTYRVTDRFTIFLDDTNYPVKDLTCAPDGIISYVSNGSFRGPDRYPIMFEGISEGQCLLRDGDFQVQITVTK